MKFVRKTFPGFSQKINFGNKLILIYLYSKFCGCVLCDKCSNLRRSLNENKVCICLVCENKFINYQMHNEFKEKIINKEFEIKEYNQKLEKVSLIHSEQIDEIAKLNELINKTKKESEIKKDNMTNETENLKKRASDVCDLSETTSTKINEAIGILKGLDEKKKIKEKEFRKIQNDREDITNEYQNRQNYLNDTHNKINQISMSIHNAESSSKIETGNKKLDSLLKEKKKTQSIANSKFEQNQNFKESTIIINPSKIIKEVYQEPLLSKTKSNNQTNKNIFRRFILYMGSQIFLKD